MLVFFDESGQPHPNDSSTRPVVVSVCMSQQDGRSVASQIHALKARLGQPDIELKGVNLVTHRVFERRSNEWELVESFFDLCRTLPFTLFGVVMERPTRVPHFHEPGNEAFLPNQYRYLLQRANQFADEQGKQAVLLFDGDGPTLWSGTLPRRFESFLYRSREGQSFTALSDAPFYVDSRITQGIQIADMTASVIRLYQENNLFAGVPVGDRFLSAINRYYGIVRSKARDLVSIEGFGRPGIYFMPERDHYRREEQPELGLEGEEPENEDGV